MKNQDDVSRRSFLKKAVYAVPTIVALGTLTTPAMAGGSRICGENNGWGNGDQTPPGNSGPHNDAENSHKGHRYYPGKSSHK